MDFSKLEGIRFNARKAGSVNYAVARKAIEAVATNRHEKRACKNEVIKFLSGVILPEPRKVLMRDGQYRLIHSVEFPDGSVAKF